MTTPLLHHWIQTLGGLEKLRQIQNIYIRSTIETGGLTGIAEERYTAQGQYRQRFDLGGAYKAETVLDPTKGQGWFLDPNDRVRELTGRDLEREITTAYLGSFSHLVPGRMPGHAEELGEDEARAHYVVRILPQGGRPVTCYLNRETYLPVREEQPEADRTRTVYFDDWRDVAGIKFPFRLRQTTGDPKYDVIVTVQEVRFNVLLDETAFQKPREAVRDFRFTSGRSALGIPFEITSNHIYLQGRINDSTPLWFVLDTGAAASVIGSEGAEALGLELKGQLEARGAGEGSTDLAFVTGVSFNLPGVELFDQTIAAIPLRPLEPYEGRTVDGVLGYDFISRFVVEIDYAARHVALHDPEGYEYAGPGESIPITLEEGVPHVRARIVQPGCDPAEGKFVIDTGSRAALSLTKPFVEAHGLLEATQETIQAPFGVGVGGETKQRIGRVKRLHLGRFVIEGPVTGFSQDVKGALASPHYAGLIGGEILRRFKVIFDYARQRMILEPNAHFAEPYEYDMSGAFLIAEGPDFNRFKVHRLIEDSPATEAGLREGDVIVALDGCPAAEFTLEQVREMFRQEGREYRLGIQRGEELLEVWIRVRRLV